MHDEKRWQFLLTRAAELYDEPSNGLAASARHAGRHGFRSGAEWMRRAMETIRGCSIDESQADFHTLGIVKYGAASAVAVGWAFATLLLNVPLLALCAAPLFYAVEAHGVFLFPVAIDGYTRPFCTARLWTVRAGGTLHVMTIVMPIAVGMLCGGLAGRGFRRSWCLGCLAICIWYEALRAGIPASRGAHAL